MDTFYVWGGVFENGRFEALEKGVGEELYGPYPTLQAATQSCLENMRGRGNIDICWHRLFVLTADELALKRQVV